MYEKRPDLAEAIRIDPTVEADDVLSPNSMAIARISGWLLALDVNNFKVHGDRAPFGLSFDMGEEGTLLAEPGDWVVKIDSSIGVMDHDHFVTQYRV